MMTAKTIYLYVKARLRLEKKIFACRTLPVFCQHFCLLFFFFGTFCLGAFVAGSPWIVCTTIRTHNHERRWRGFFSGVFSDTFRSFDANKQSSLGLDGCRPSQAQYVIFCRRRRGGGHGMAELKMSFFFSGRHKASKFPLRNTSEPRKFPPPKMWRNKKKKRKKGSVVFAPK